MKQLILDLSPTYIPFIVQCTKATGDKVDPTVDNLIIYEEGGVDAVFDSTQITGSPFDPAQVNAKTGLWGVLVAKSVFTAGKCYIALWEMTVDGLTTAKVEKYLAINASQLKADITTVAKASALATHDGKLNIVDTVVDAIKAKTDNLPANPASSQYVIVGAAVYNSTDDSLIINASIEKDGELQTTPTSATCDIYDADGSIVGSQLSDSSPDLQGIFKFTQAATTIVTDKTYYAKIAIILSGVTYTGIIPIATAD